MEFNPILPNNNIKKLPPIINREDTDLLKKINQANIALLELKWSTQLLPDPMILINYISIKESVDSNAIENIHTTIESALLEEQTEISNRKKNEKEVINYKEGAIYWFNRVVINNGIMINDLVKINNIILENDSWIITSPDKKIQVKETWEILYTPPQWLSLIKSLCDNLEKFINNMDIWDDNDPIMKLPLIHYQFEAIHPFWDWNGRVWRILIVLYLVLINKLSYPILFLSEYIHHNKRDYYAHLNTIDRVWLWNSKDFSLWMFDAIIQQSFKTKKIIDEIRELMYSTKNLIRKSKKIQWIYSKELLEYLFKSSIYSIQWLSDALNVHRNTASTYLKKMEKEGICKKI